MSGDIHLNYDDVRVLSAALLRFAGDIANGTISAEKPADEDRARRLARVIGYYNLTEVSNEQEAQHQAPPVSVGVQAEGAGTGDQPVVGPDPVGRQAQLIQALRNLKALNRTPITEEL